MHNLFFFNLKCFIPKHFLWRRLKSKTYVLVSPLFMRKKRPEKCPYVYANRYTCGCGLKLALLHVAHLILLLHLMISLQDVQLTNPLFGLILFPNCDGNIVFIESLAFLCHWKVIPPNFHM